MRRYARGQLFGPIQKCPAFSKADFFSELGIVQRGVHSTFEVDLGATFIRDTRRPIFWSSLEYGGGSHVTRMRVISLLVHPNYTSNSMIEFFWSTFIRWIFFLEIST